MTFFKSTILTSASLLLGFGLSACAQETVDVDSAAKDLQTKSTTETAAEMTAPTSQAEATPTSAPADTPQTADDHKDHHADHNHSKPDVSASDVDYVYDIAPEDFLWGNADASVDMIVYASVVCRHCGKWFTNEWPTLKADYVDTGKVRVAFREIITQPQQIAVPGYMIAACAPEGQHEDLIVHQMQTQEKTFASLQDGTIQDVVIGWADMAGLDDMEKLQACFERTDHAPRINLSGERMTAAGMQGVPGIIIDGKIFEPQDKNAKALSAVLDAALK